MREIGYSISTLFAATFLAACATKPLAVPQEAGFGVLCVSQDKLGFIVTATKKDDLVSRGVPADWFVSNGSNYYISAEHESAAAGLLLRYRNP